MGNIETTQVIVNNTSSIYQMSKLGSYSKNTRFHEFDEIGKRIAVLNQYFYPGLLSLFENKPGERISQEMRTFS